MRVAVLLMVLVLAAPAAACTGDCDADGGVSIAELVRSVGIALGELQLDSCAGVDVDGDGEVRVEELIAAVSDALGECATQNECIPVPGTALATRLVTDAVERPVHVTAPPGDRRRIFIVEQRGRIRIVKDGLLIAEPAFLSIIDQVSCCGERGLFSIAFHPDYASNGRFFVNYTDRGGSTVISRFQVSADPDRADPTSERILLTIAQPFPNHNGGQLAFGPDGYLYVGMGDGGGGGDPSDNAQNDDSLLGKLLRFDVDIEDAPYYAVPESNPALERGAPLGLIWAKGLRNPWRFSFDRATGDLYIADVGQARLEEINVQPAASRGGENYGWDFFEGDSCFEPDPGPLCPEPPGFTFPVLTYGRRDGCSVTGGFVYRGCALPDLQGEYFYSDYCSAFVRTVRYEQGAATRRQDRTDALDPPGDLTLDNISSFGEDADGELYITDLDGEVYQIVPAPR